MLDPEQVLRHPDATGEGASIAVIDTGIDPAWLSTRHAALPTLKQCAVRQGRVLTEWNSPPSSPHGTIVADIILTLAPKASLHSVDVFGPGSACTVEDLVAAIRHVLHLSTVKIINLSLGVPERKLQMPQQRRLLQQAIDDAYRQDVLVIAAAHNDHPITRSVPSSFTSAVFSVDKALFDDELLCKYSAREQVEFLAHGRGYLGPFSREPATSWAAPHLSGIAARILSLKPSLKPFELKTILYWMSQSLAAK